MVHKELGTSLEFGCIVFLYLGIDSNLYFDICFFDVLRVMWSMMQTMVLKPSEEVPPPAQFGVFILVFFLSS